MVWEKGVSCAYLSRVAKSTPCYLRSDFFDVDILADDHGVVASSGNHVNESMPLAMVSPRVDLQFQRDSFQGLSGFSHDLFARRYRARKGNLVNLGMLYKPWSETVVAA